MSGRLIILPKKSYCPWKPENVERVLRDERLDQERRDKEQEQMRQEESRARMRAFKKDPEQQNEQQRHINLFEQEEQTVNERAVKGIKASGLQVATFGQVTRTNPFYLQISLPLSSKIYSEDAGTSMKERKRKAAIDPMHTFVTESSCTNVGSRRCDSSDSEPSTGARRQRRHEKKKRKSKESSTRSSMEELRQRRKDREEIEVRRAASLTRTEQDGRSNRYQNQYNPDLSRR
jgi:hypothetical protein